MPLTVYAFITEERREIKELVNELRFYKKKKKLNFI